MIILDTHIWVWNTQGDSRLKDDVRQVIERSISDGIGISAVSFWEIAKAVQLGRLELPVDVADWFKVALAYPGIRILPLTEEIAVESTRLPGTFHKDPFDQLIVATARIHDVPLITADTEILAYEHVKLANSDRR